MTAGTAESKHMASFQNPFPALLRAQRLGISHSGQKFFGQVRQTNNKRRTRRENEIGGHMGTRQVLTQLHGAAHTGDRRCNPSLVKVGGTR
jgi:hypothetical protein